MSTIGKPINLPNDNITPKQLKFQVEGFVRNPDTRNLYSKGYTTT